MKNNFLKDFRENSWGISEVHTFAEYKAEEVWAGPSFPPHSFENGWSNMGKL